MAIRLGCQMPKFTYSATAADLFPTMIAQAREAESAGFDCAFVADHFFQTPALGPAGGPRPEAYTTLGALATATEKIGLAALVTSNTFRNPALLAKAVSTLDVVSGGRAVLGIGAGWYELEHQQYGYEFGTFAERFERLEEALQIIAPMLRGDRPTFEGKWYRVESAINEPRIRVDLPIMLGGGGEKKTFALAARFADHLNIICAISDLPRKLDALDARCAEVGRDRSTLETSYLAFVFIDENGDRARKLQHDFLLDLGVDLAEASDAERAWATAQQVCGTPDEVAEQLQTRVLDKGIDGIIVNLVANGHQPGIVELAGRTVRPLVAP
ncbi:LLM class F420-dependent oxidoreductase [Rhodococcus sp. WMMA185]|uniref:LLM class F420-dependent oxidoreductase n=1 Tax=Rhodococcus sp. WMMA185 TaxID=679318 RepID=UPI000A036BD0|nr:LLM class F420-dependent oxidoreductase [Rhodococcus sp. WMMA185]